MNTVYPPRRILFPVDFSARSIALAPTVTAFAQYFQASLTILHVLLDNTPDEQRIRVQEDLAAFAWPAFSGMTACRAIATGNVAEEIVKVVQENKIDLVMMPTHGYGPFRRFLLGSVTMKVLHDASCPVFTDVHTESAGRPVPTRPDGRLGYRSIVCAVDLTPCSRATMRWATQFAKENSSKLTLVHAIPLTIPLSGPDTPLLDWTSGMQNIARKAIAEIQEEEDIDAPLEIVTGEVEYALHDAALNLKADLLIVGRGNEEQHQCGLRPHTYPIIRQAPCPVISV
jgi:nucleotide-binding universal stress UspA family protein